MPNFADQYRAAKIRSRQQNTRLADFERTLDFPIDDFQRQACESVEAQRAVLVAAPTGAGKTLVGEFAIYLALAQQKKAFYTTPIKALSNQKYRDLVEVYGAESVGLLTGDTSLNSEAPVVVMTTEVLRNMLYADSATLDNLGYVVMDEVHYLADRFRGAVWEEVIIHLPEHISLISLSATISNAEEFGAWLDTVRGATDVVVSEHRPVPLGQQVMVGNRLFDLFMSDTTVEEAAELRESKESRVPEINRELLRVTDRDRPPRARERSRGGRNRLRQGRQPKSGDKNFRGQRPGSRVSRAATVLSLDRAGLLPSICFVFSRAGCDAAVRQCIDADLRLTTGTEAQTIRAYVSEATASLEVKDLNVLGFYEWREGLERGIAAHHAGLLPVFKEVVEALFAEGLIKVVFATETLALGINMPARSVVLEKLTKFNGETHRDITPGEYTQLTGRAGRRGIDLEGYAVVLWKPGLQPEQVAALASKRTYPLNSSFRPTYNMSANLVAQFGRERTTKILELSFAQFQADRSVVGLAQRVRKNERALEGYAESMRCHLGDFTEYAAIQRQLKDLEKKAEKDRQKFELSQAAASIHRLLPGDIVDIPYGRYRGYAVVIGRSDREFNPRPAIITEQAQLRHLDSGDLAGALEPISRARVPKNFTGKTPKQRRDMAARMRQAIHDGVSPRQETRAFVFDHRENKHAHEIEQLRNRLKNHPCHGCSERENHARWGQRWWILERETEGLRRKIGRRTTTIAQVFDRICDLLTDYGYLEVNGEGKTVLTARGGNLRGVYGEKDLLTAICLEKGLVDGLDPAATASVMSALVFEAKRDEAGLLTRYPRSSIEKAAGVLLHSWERLNAAEEKYHLPRTPSPDFGMIWPTYRWARGESLTRVLEGTDLAAGDFVRWIKQVIDTLDQIAHLGGVDPQLWTQCEAAINLLRRGVVATQLEEKI